MNESFPKGKFFDLSLRARAQRQATALSVFIRYSAGALCQNADSAKGNTIEIFDLCHFYSKAMTTTLTPYNVRLLQLTDQAARNLKPITTLDTFDGATKNFHPDGLFSNEIFGMNGDKTRMRRFAYIDVKIPIMHPLVYRTLGRLKRMYPEIMAGKTYALWDEATKDFVKSDALDGKTGYTFFMEHFDQIVFPQRLSDLRELNIKFIERARSISMNTKIVVSPAGFRDYIITSDGFEEEDEVNKLYRKMLAFSNSVTVEMFRMNPQMYDRVRFSLQSTFNALYEYHENMVRGKHKLLQGRVMSRQVRDGTRAVITTQNLEIKELFAPGTPTTNSTGIGLYQYIKAFRPLCIFHLQNGYLKNVFSSPGAPARLVNPKTLHSEMAQVSLESFDLWMTKEGIEKLFNLFGEVERRHEPVMIDDYYLALRYNDGKVFKLFGDIDELPEGFERKHVQPVSFAELIYSQTYQTENNVAMVNTRFPVTGFGSIYPTEPFLKVTSHTVSLKPLDDNWQIDDSLPIMREFPMREETFIDTMMPSSDKLALAGADFDGDKMTGNGLYLKESVAESKAVMRSRNFHVRTDGSIAHSLNTVTVDFLLGAMTSAPIQPASEGLQEPFGYKDRLTGADMSVIYLGDKMYSPDVLYKIINKDDQEPIEVRIDQLGYPRTMMRVPEDLVAKANLKRGILVTGPTKWHGKDHYNVIWGYDVLIKAMDEGLELLKAYVITEGDLKCAEILPEEA